MKRLASALRATGRFHSRPQGRVKAVLRTEMARTGPRASAMVAANVTTSSRATLLDQVATANASSSTSSGMPT